MRRFLSRSEKKKEFFVDEANRAKKRFWLIYGDGDGKYNQYDRVTLLGDDSRTEMSWGDFKRFANTPRGRQQLFDHFADVVVWATMLVVSGIASYGVGRVCEKVFEPKRKEKEFLLMKPIEQRNVFGLFMEMVKENINNMTVSRC